MVTKIISSQQEEGSCYESLLDRSNFNIKKIGGTNFYIYALLLGMNNGLLNKVKTWPVIKKAWSDFSFTIKNDGLLRYVQPIGAA